MSFLQHRAGDVGACPGRTPAACRGGCGTWRTRSSPGSRGRRVGWRGCCPGPWTRPGVNLVHATGRAAWQSVFHFHLHVVPRYRSDELQVMWHAALVPDADLTALRARVLAAKRSY